MLPISLSCLMVLLSLLSSFPTGICTGVVVVVSHPSPENHMLRRPVTCEVEFFPRCVPIFSFLLISLISRL